MNTEKLQPLGLGPLLPDDLDESDEDDYSEADAERAFAAWESEYDYNSRG